MISRLDQLPSLGALRTFDAVVSAASFSRAASQLHVTQSAVSHRIRGLESALGTPLFVRRGNHVTLTPAGHILHTATREAFARLELGLRELQTSRDETTVSVSCSPSFAIRWLVPHLRSLRETEPHLDVRIAADDRLIAPGTQGVDICIRFGPGDYSGCKVERLTREVIRAVCSPLYREQRHIESGSQVLGGTLLHADVLSEHPKHLGWGAWLDAARLSGEPAGEYHFSHAHMALDAAVAGQGIALGRTTLTRQALRTGRLVALDGPELDSGFCYWLVSPKGSQQRDAATRFASWLRAAVHEH